MNMKTCFLSCLASVFTGVSALAEVPARTCNIQKLTVTCLDLGPDIANCYVVSSPDHDAYVIDPGGNAEAIGTYLKVKKLNVLSYLVTHGHNDHIKGLPQLEQIVPAPAGIHSSDVPLYRKRMGNNGPFSLFFEEGQTYGTNDLAFTVIHTPGHSPGGVCFYFKQAGVLFTGDTLFNNGVGRTDLDGGSSSQLQTSLNKLKKLPPMTVAFPGHGDRTVLKNERVLTR